mmetsp:Transcript_5164/g.15330  ORF Transcript_5164/g.15330 Transcript_5164/m.15330 type:complete len:196 (-) Transcript_5164:565-1152(-)
MAEFDDLGKLMHGARHAMDVALNAEGGGDAMAAVRAFDAERFNEAGAADAEPDEIHPDGVVAERALSRVCEDCGFHCPDGFWDEVLLGDLMIQAAPGALKEPTLAAVDAWLAPRAPPPVSLESVACDWRVGGARVAVWRGDIRVRAPRGSASDARRTDASPRRASTGSDALPRRASTGADASPRRASRGTDDLYS